MVVKRYKVKSYEVNLARQMEIGGGVSGIKYYAIILCRSREGDRFAIFFLRPDSNIVDNVYNPDAKWATACLPAEQYKWYIDLLRNERPVYAYLNSDNPNGNTLYTGQEPVGEHELKNLPFQ